MLGLHFCARAFSSCGERGPLLIAVRGPLTVAASLVAEHRLQTRRLSSCGPRAQLLRGMRDPPRPGPEPVSPALAGRFPTTAPSGKPGYFILWLTKPVMCSVKVFLAYLQYICEGEEMPGGGLGSSLKIHALGEKIFLKNLVNNYVVSHVE